MVSSVSSVTSVVNALTQRQLGVLRVLCGSSSYGAPAPYPRSCAEMRGEFSALADGVISMIVAPEVSSIDPTASIVINDVPAHTVTSNDDDSRFQEEAAKLPAAERKRCRT